MAVRPGQPPTSPGGFGTPDSITSEAFVRSDLAVKSEWMGEVDRVVTYEVTRPLPAIAGPVGPQVEPGRYLPGGGNQYQLLVPESDRMDFLRVVGVRPI